jgi:hypothetical protein
MSEPQMPALVTRTIASPDSKIDGSGTFSRLTSPGALKTSPRILHPSLVAPSLGRAGIAIQAP